jgi:hypothetical protein
LYGIGSLDAVMQVEIEADDIERSGIARVAVGARRLLRGHAEHKVKGAVERAANANVQCDDNRFRGTKIRQIHTAALLEHSGRAAGVAVAVGVAADGEAVEGEWSSSRS